MASVGRVTVSERRSTKPSVTAPAYRQRPVRRPGPDELLALATDIAASAAALLAARSGERPTHVATKTTRTDMVTEVDRAAEALIVARIDEARPDDAILGEEGSRRRGTSGV